MNRNLFLFLSFIAILFSGCSKVLDRPVAGINAKKEFAKLKKLEGNWQSHSQIHASPEKVTYRVTSGGNVVQETLFPGTPHEMLSVYHVEGNDLVMTHYCMLPNQPKLQAQSVQDDKLVFELIPTPGIDPTVDEHMHRLTLTLAEPDRIIQEWTSYKDGKPTETKTIDLVRSY